MNEELPKNWVKTEVKMLSELIRGVSYKKEDAKSFRNEGDYLILRGGNIQDGIIVGNAGEVYIDEKFIKENQKIRKGDIIIVGSTGSKKLIGKAGIAQADYENVSFGAFLMLIRPLKGLNPGFFDYYFLSDNYRERIRELAGGININNIRKDYIEELKFPLPPLPEQNRIVVKLDKLFKQLEVIKERITTLKAIKERFIYSCLVNNQTKQFFPRQKIGRYLEERSERIGKNWESCRKIGVSAKKGIIDLSTGQKMTFENYKVVIPGDFIYNTMRVNIGSIAIYTGKEIVITSPDYVVFRVKEFLSSELLLGFLKSKQGLLEIGANTKGSVRARLYFKSLSEIRMPVSGQKTQILAEKFLTTYSHSLRKIKNISMTKLVDLEKAILTKAFKGELVPQLQSDGDARELLEEIEKLRKERGKRKKESSQKFRS
ncbi:restriction endonuclease subunit S [Gillisia sp. Q332]|uniref:restriction endonuclease subunit S n=1 Tax=Gillisia xinjiangensis TaxID=3384765 RepID=UPI00391CEB99